MKGPSKSSSHRKANSRTWRPPAKSLKQTRSPAYAYHLLSPYTYELVVRISATGPLGKTRVILSIVKQLAMSCLRDAPNEWGASHLAMQHLRCGCVIALRRAWSFPST